MKKSIIGLTLVELVFVLAIIAILIQASVLITNLIDKIQLSSSIRQLHTEIQFARSKAINEYKWITICGSNDGIVCSKDWQSAELLIFHDIDNNHELDTSDTLYRRVRLTVKIHWRGSNRNYMRARPNGSLIEWGKYTFCSANLNVPTKQLVLNRMGRGYISTPKPKELIEKNLC